MKVDSGSYKFIITAGGTREPIDPVRFIGNRSSGKMGLALLGACLKASLKTVLIHANITETMPKGKYKAVSVETTEEMYHAIKREWSPHTVLIMAAAPADFRPVTVSSVKIKKNLQNGKALTLKLRTTRDILAELGRSKKGDRFIAAFAAETNDLLENAKKKMQFKNADLMIANDVSRRDSGFGSNTNQVLFLEPGWEITRLPLMSKKKLGGLILKTIFSKL
jgi:phosphopantothenoylcysteine decarboxylase / phosphopantothenate---cysteine ligase